MVGNPSVRLIFALTLGLVVGFLNGCSKNPTTFTPSPRAFATFALVVNDAEMWVNTDPTNRFYGMVAPTNSMQPFVNEHSLVLLVRYTGQPLINGAVVSYHYSDKFSHVLHVVSAQTDDSVYMSGYNNATSDGWKKKTSIEGVLVGQLYLP